MNENEELRESLLRLAERVFASKGATRSELSDVAHAAGVPVTEVSRVFSSKDELFLIVATRSARVLLDYFNACLAKTADQPTFELITNLSYAAIAFARQHSDKFRLAVMTEGMGYAVDPQHPLFPEYQSVLKGITEFGTGLIARGQRDGSVRSDMPPENINMIVWGAFTGIMSMDPHMGDPQSGVRPRDGADQTLGAVQRLVETLRPTRP